MKTNYSETIKGMKEFEEKNSLEKNIIKIIFNMSQEEIDHFFVDGINDLGIDYFIFKKNNKYFKNENDFVISNDDNFEITLVQFKSGNHSFKESIFNKINIFLEKLFSDDFQESELSNEKLSNKIKKYSRIKEHSIKYDIKLKVMVKVIVLTDSEISKTIESTISTILKKLDSETTLNNDSEYFEVLNARNLFYLIKRNNEKINYHPIEIDSKISIPSNFNEKKKEEIFDKECKKSVLAFVPLVEIKKLFKEYGDDILNQNVRNFNGETKVNKEIRKTLEDKKEIYDFWNFNNGITICAEKINSNNKKISVVRPKIIDGGQTSYLISKTDDGNLLDKSIIVKFINIKDDKEKREKIVLSNNSKNPHKAVNKISILNEQFLIEAALKKRDYYYERIENGYSYNDLIDKNKIITVENLCKSFLIIFLLEPLEFRNSKSKYFSPNTKEYKSIFDNQKNNIDSYIKSYEIWKSYDLFLKDNLKEFLKENFQFNSGDKTTNDVLRYAALSNYIFLKMENIKPIDNIIKFNNLNIVFDLKEIKNSFNDVYKIMEKELEKNKDLSFVNMIKSIKYSHLLK